MRVGQFLKRRNIGLAYLNMVCIYLSYDKVGLNSKLSLFEIKLFDETLISEPFNEWVAIKYKLVQNLHYTSKTELSLDLSGQILEALNFLLTNKNPFSVGTTNRLLKIIQSNEPVSVKISDLKASAPFREPKVVTNSNNTNTHSEYYDPHEDFQWGGLSGEEAFVGYSNTE